MALTVFDCLRGENAYPLTERTLSKFAIKRGLDLEAEATSDIISGNAYRLTEADILMWLSVAPDISQGGQSYSFTDEQRLRFRKRAKAVYDELGDEDDGLYAEYGYKGSRL